MRPTVIVSENFARQVWGSAAAAVGKRVRQFDNAPWEEVIGVAQDVRQHGADAEPPAIIYWPPMQQQSLEASMSHTPSVGGVRDAQPTRGDRGVAAGDAAGGVGCEWQPAGLRVDHAWTSMTTRWRDFVRACHVGIAGAMSLLLGIIGIYGVISYAVSQRHGSRNPLALGAQRSELRWMRALCAGAGPAWRSHRPGRGRGSNAAMNRCFPSEPVDPVTLRIDRHPLLAVCAAVRASYLPARRAAAVNPVEALRAE